MIKKIHSRVVNSSRLETAPVEQKYYAQKNVSSINDSRSFDHCRPTQNSNTLEIYRSRRKLAVLVNEKIKPGRFFDCFL